MPVCFDETGVEYSGPGSLEMFERKFMTKKISQREARLLKKRVQKLEGDLKNSYAGTRVDTWTLSDVQFARIKTANTLGYGLILFPEFSGATNVKVMAVKL